MRFALHTLRIKEREASISFYRDRLGMALLAQLERDVAGRKRTRIFLGFTNDASEAGAAPALARRDCTLLELVHDEGAETDPGTTYQPSREDGYWKIGVTLKDVDEAASRLRAAGVAVTDAQQFFDVGYLCHLSDPNGFCIELLQHDFAAHHRRAPPDPRYTLGSAPTLGQVTLRVKDPQRSLAFYCARLGMRLLSRQIVQPYRFTLYFLAFTSEQAPSRNVDAVENREWLWQRPYTILELQHVWGTESGSARYATHHDDRIGFCGIGFATRDIKGALERLGYDAGEIDGFLELDTELDALAATVPDADGFNVRLVEPRS